MKMPQGAKFYFFAPSVVAKNRRKLIKNLESLRGLQNNLSRLRLLVLIPYGVANLIFSKSHATAFFARVA